MKQSKHNAPPGGRFIGGMSRLMVSLMWGILLVVVIAVVILATRFYA